VIQKRSKRLPKRALGHLNLEPDDAVHTENSEKRPSGSVQAPLKTEANETGRNLSSNSLRYLSWLKEKMCREEQTVVQQLRAAADQFSNESASTVQSAQLHGMQLFGMAIQGHEVQAKYDKRLCEDLTEMLPPGMDLKDADDAMMGKEVQNAGVEAECGELCKMPEKEMVSLTEHLHIMSEEGDIRHIGEQTIKEYSEIMDKYMESACRCDSPSCMLDDKTYPDRDRYWCYIRTDTMAHCKKKGIKINTDANTGKPWSFQLCESDGKPRPCQCQQFGQALADLSNKHRLHSTPLFGASCSKWDSGALQWCYVGLDTTCHRRVQDRPSRGDDRDGFFKSFEACEADAEAKQLCQHYRMFLPPIAAVHMLCVIPMALVILNFISIQCSDYVEAAEQFVVQESESEEEVDATQAAVEEQDGLRKDESAS